jgi:tyrosyl-tRNA synthetase
MELKKRLAREIVAQLYDKKAASEAEERFANVFQKGEIPEGIPVYLYPLTIAAQGTDLRRLLKEIGIARGSTDAARLINQGAVEIDGKKVTTFFAPVESGSIIKVGKRRFARVINTDRQVEKGE